MTQTAYYQKPNQDFLEILVYFSNEIMLYSQTKHYYNQTKHMKNMFLSFGLRFHIHFIIVNLKNLVFY